MSNDQMRHLIEIVSGQHGKKSGLKESEETLGGDGDKYQFMLLNRLQSDCEYVLGAARNTNNPEHHLWAGNIEDHILEMKKLYTMLVERHGPIEWINMDMIENYENEIHNLIGR